MPFSKLTLTVLPQPLALCRFGPYDDLPAWAGKSTFLTVSRTLDELSVVCDQSVMPETQKAERDWRAFRVSGTLDLNQTGIISSLANPLAEIGIPIFAISTYDTDYILVRATVLRKALDTLAKTCQILE